MAKAIRMGKKDIRDIQQVDAQKAVMSINPTVAGKLGISIDKEILREARIVVGGK